MGYERFDKEEVFALRVTLAAAREVAREPSPENAKRLALVVERADARAGLSLARDGQPTEPRINIKGVLVHAVCCRACGGYGYNMESDTHGNAPYGREWQATCEQCDGEGAFEDSDCSCAKCQQMFNAIEAVNG